MQWRWWRVKTSGTLRKCTFKHVQLLVHAHADGGLLVPSARTNATSSSFNSATKRHSNATM